MLLLFYALLLISSVAAHGVPSELWADLGNGTLAALKETTGETLWAAEVAGEYVAAYGDLVFITTPVNSSTTVTAATVTQTAAAAAAAAQTTKGNTTAYRTRESSEYPAPNGITKKVHKGNSASEHFMSARNDDEPEETATFGHSAKGRNGGAAAVDLVALNAINGREVWRAQLPQGRPFSLTPYGQGSRALLYYSSSLDILDISPEGGCAMMANTTAGTANASNATRVCLTQAMAHGVLLATVQPNPNGIRAIWFNQRTETSVFFDMPNGTVSPAPPAALDVCLSANTPEPRFYSTGTDFDSLTVTRRDIWELSDMGDATINQNVPDASSLAGLDYGGQMGVLYPNLWVQSVQRYALAAVNASTMKVLWQRHDLPVDGSYTITKALRDGVLVGANNTAGTVALLDATTGKPVWTLPLMPALTYSILTPLRNGGFLATSGSRVACYSGAGAVLWQRTFAQGSSGGIHACRSPLGLFFGGAIAEYIFQPCLLG